MVLAAAAAVRLAHIIALAIVAVVVRGFVAGDACVWGWGGRDEGAILSAGLAMYASGGSCQVLPVGCWRVGEGLTVGGRKSV